eukprot:TRINITY_DN38240_c0_g1_i1.p1 TRINITY_DN38240_c0_g1~~TRINITY_DN38240_c0_g1_i1.p1  ORF type:complete len:132 (+),score=28.79 TRINITY_DN38240_c0_g1_i1:262-657(+)
MGKSIASKRRERKARKKRELRGDPFTRKIKITNAPVSVSGKRRRKLLRKWRRDQKEALQHGLVSMEDIEAMAIDTPVNDNNGSGSSHVSSSKTFAGLSLKKRAKLRTKINRGKRAGKNEAVSVPCGDAMVE